MRSGDSFMVGDWTVEPDLDRISRRDEQKTLRPQVMELLVYLASRDGQVARSEALLKDLWPGKFVTNATLYNCVAELRHELDDGSEGAGSIQTIPKKGYRLLRPVTGLAKESSSRNRRPAVIVAAILAITLGYIVVDQLIDKVGPSPRVQAVPSVAVLPFVALTSGSEDEFFADGLTEELINSLSRLKNLKVAGRTSSFYYKGKDQDLRLIGSALGVDNILEGSVRRVGNDLRITAQLLTADDGFQLWSHSYDRSLDDIFEIQQDIASQVTAALTVSLFGDETKALGKSGTSNMEAQINYLIASAHIRRGATMWIDATQKNEHLKVARRLLDQAVELDPNFAEAWAKLVPAYYLLAGFGFSDGSGEMITKSEATSLADFAAAKAIKLAPQLPEAWVAVGIHKGFGEDLRADRVQLGEAIAAFDQALRIDPDNLSALESYASFRYDWGQYAAAMRLYDRAVALDPISTIRLRRARAMYRAGHVEAARREYFEVARLYPDAPYEGGIAEIEFDRGHFHHGLLWLSDFEGSLPPPYAWASLGDMARALESITPYKEAGGLIAQLADIADHFFMRDYQTLINGIPTFDKIGGSKRLFLLPSLYYGRRWNEAILMAESLRGHAEDVAGLARSGNLQYKPWGLGQSATQAAYYAHALTSVGRHEEAESVRHWALDLVDRLPKHTPRRTQERHHLRLLVFASRGEKDAAIRELEAMIDAGWRWLMCPGNLDTRVYAIDFGWFEDSPLLDSIRNEPRFIAAIEKVKADNAAMLAELEAGLTLEDIMYERMN